jgi:hypothetical protein
MQIKEERLGISTVMKIQVRVITPCCLHLQFTLNMETTRPSETMVSYITTRFHNTNDHDLKLKRKRHYISTTVKKTNIYELIYKQE